MLYVINILLHFIFIYIQCSINYKLSNNITYYDINNATIKYGDLISKKDVLKIEDGFYRSFYCKNEMCTSVDNTYQDYFVMLPNENGTMQRYIIITFHYDDIQEYQYNKKICRNNECISYECKTNSQCLYDKCINGYCIFNNDNSISHCDNIYSGHQKSYMHCGKAYPDNCITNEECSSMNCYDNKCTQQLQGPSDSDGSSDMMTIVYIILTVFILFFLSPLFYYICCYKCHKENKKYDNL